MTEKLDKCEVVELYNANSSIPLGEIDFLKDGYIINMDNTPLEVHPILGQRRHWHIYTVKDHEVVGLTGLNSDSLLRLDKFIKELNEADD